MSQQLSEMHRASGKIVSLAMLIDGWVGNEERLALKSCGVLEELGLDEESFEQIFAEFTAETSNLDGAEYTVQQRIDKAFVERLLGEIQDPALQAKLLEAIACVVYADGMLSSEEAELMNLARAHWNPAPTRIN